MKNKQNNTERILQEKDQKIKQLKTWSKVLDVMIWITIIGVITSLYFAFKIMM